MGGSSKATPPTHRLTRPIVFRSVAAAEIGDAVEWYAARNPELAADFLKVLDATIASVQENPLQFPKVHAEARRVLMPRFPYSIIFTVAADEIVVLACFHARRDPKRWSARV